jgi:hypothetical protein
MFFLKNSKALLFAIVQVVLFSTFGWSQNAGMLQPLTPTNGAERVEMQPLFSWLFSQIGDYAEPNYTLVVVQKKDGQTPEIALAANPVLLRQEGIKTKQWLYNAIGASALKTCQQYAWQVQATDPASGKVVATSAAWSFSTTCAKGIEPTPIPESFIVLGDAATYPYRVSNTLRVCFDNPYDGSDFAKITLLDDAGNEVKNAIVPEYPNADQKGIASGRNWVRFALPALADAKSYTFTFNLKNGFNKTIPFVYFSK